jgi:hypothetical protein
LRRLGGLVVAVFAALLVAVILGQLAGPPDYDPPAWAGLLVLAAFAGALWAWFRRVPPID